MPTLLIFRRAKLMSVTTLLYNVKVSQGALALVIRALGTTELSFCEVYFYEK